MLKFETGNVELNTESMRQLGMVLEQQGLCAEVEINGEVFIAQKFDQDTRMMYFTSKERQVDAGRMNGYTQMHVRELMSGYAANSETRLLNMLNTGEFRIS